MIVIIGILIVIGSVIGGFMMGGGSVAALWHPNEVIIIGGGAFGAMVIMSPKKVLMDMGTGVMHCFKGAPYSKQTYEELLKVMFELFLLGRRNGMVALEEHVIDPSKSSIFNKYPGFTAHKEDVEFLCNSLRPIIDGKIKPDQLRMLLDVELNRKEDEHHAPSAVLGKAGDSMPGFGIVAAVLGIVITMGSISGPIEMIGEHVAAALVGTFLGILLAYGFINPLAANMEFVGNAELDFIKCIASCVVGFANGLAPITAVELGRRGMATDLRPTAEGLEEMTKGLKSGK